MAFNKLTIQSTAQILLHAPKVIVVKGGPLDGEMKDHSTDHRHTIGKLHLVIRYLVEQHKLQRFYTTGIEGLNPDPHTHLWNMVQLHGDPQWRICVSCQTTYLDQEGVRCKLCIIKRPNTRGRGLLKLYLSERAQRLSQKHIDQIKAHDCKTPPAVLLLLGIPAQDTRLQNFVNDISGAVTREHGTIISIGTDNEQTVNRATRSRPATYSLSVHPENWATAIMEVISPSSTTEDRKRSRASSPAPPPRKRPATSSGKQNASSAATPTQRNSMDGCRVDDHAGAFKRKIMIDTTGEGLATGPSGSNDIVTPGLGQKRADVPDAPTSRRTNRETPSLVRVHEASKSMSGALNVSPVKNEVDERRGPANFGLGAGFKRTSGYNTMANTPGGTPQVKLEVDAPGCDIPQVKPEVNASPSAPQAAKYNTLPSTRRQPSYIGRLGSKSRISCKTMANTAGGTPQVKLEVDAPGNLGGPGSNNRIQRTVRDMISLYEGRRPFCRKHCRPGNDCCN
ncbi:hypothetical protein FN846DRAFT_896345 [Sphaerosporella brunnea]|uniref:Uncharacterized protein n=1 Tax=Sphaerosporella brunnea TaxID=1250544 RepID=A0A5J5ECR2_9PEZI|nr:hypothetical protein FN846DRAFT_896345 [Sphaerosporella brunnea]